MVMPWRIQHRPGDVDSAYWVRSIEDDDSEPALGRRLHRCVQGSGVREEACAHVGKIDQDRIDIGRQNHRTWRPKNLCSFLGRPAIETEDGQLGLAVDAVIDESVAIRRQTMLGAEQRHQREIATGRKHVGGAGAVAGASTVVGEQCEARAAQASKVFGDKSVDPNLQRQCGKRGIGRGGRRFSERRSREGGNRARKRVDRAFAIRVNAIAEKQYEDVLVWIDPQRCAGVAAVADGAAGKRGTAIRGIAGLHVPTEGANATWHIVRRQHLRKRPGGEHAGVVECPEAQYHSRIAREILRRREKPGVPGHATQAKCSRVVHFPAHPQAASLLGRGETPPILG
jgi:hypothetical protein